MTSALKALFNYLMIQHGIRLRSPRLPACSPATKERPMTLIERIRAQRIAEKRERQGRQLGLEEGLAKGFRKGLKRSACCRIAYRQTIDAGGRT